MSERTTDVREDILRAAAALLAHGGREAVSTRAVSVAAGVQPPTIYRQFGDMRGLLDAVAREVLAEYVRETATPEPADDPVEELRRGWDLHVAFGLANPAAYTLVYGEPAAAANATAARDSEAILHGLVTRIARAGRLRVSVPHAVQLMVAAGMGATLLLIATPPEARDLKISAATREAMIAAITTVPTSDGAPGGAPGQGLVVARAVALRAVLVEAPGVFSPAEGQLLGEWLDRLAGADG